ncbi:MAG: hypothetical protein HQL66_09060, partial [Magnetococcales bacterium]|nr:hypothetical protein [Magnetococcales bacterium]
MILNIVVVLGGLAYAGYQVFREKQALRREGEARAATASHPSTADRRANLPIPTAGGLSQVEVSDFLHISGASLGFAAAGALINPLYTLVSVPLTLYAAQPMFRTAVR